MEREKTYALLHIVKRIARNRQTQNRIAENPRRDQLRPEALVRVFERLGLHDLGLHVRRQRPLDRDFKLLVNVGLRFVGLFDHCYFAVACFGGIRRRQGIGLVGALGTPRYVVPVGKGVDVEDVDVRGLDEQVGWERGEHVPRVEVHERGDKVQAVGGCQSDDDDTRGCGVEKGAQEFRGTLIEDDVGFRRVG